MQNRFASADKRDTCTRLQKEFSRSASDAAGGSCDDYFFISHLSARSSKYQLNPAQSPHSTFELPVTERQTLMDTYALSDLNQQYLELFVSRKLIDAETRAALEKIMEMKSLIAALNERIAAADRETLEIGTDQTRLRENIATLKDTAETKQLIARYVAKAGEQETRLEQLAKEKREAVLEKVRLQSDLSAAIRAMSLNRQL
jgi:hypothetical protein